MVLLVVVRCFLSGGEREVLAELQEDDRTVGGCSCGGDSNVVSNLSLCFLFESIDGCGSREQRGDSIEEVICLDSIT